MTSKDPIQTIIENINKKYLSRTSKEYIDRQQFENHFVDIIDKRNLLEYNYLIENIDPEKIRRFAKKVAEASSQKTGSKLDYVKFTKGLAKAVKKAKGEREEFIKSLKEQEIAEQLLDYNFSNVWIYGFRSLIQEETEVELIRKELTKTYYSYLKGKEKDTPQIPLATLAQMLANHQRGNKIDLTKVDLLRYYPHNRTDIIEAIVQVLKSIENNKLDHIQPLNDYIASQKLNPAAGTPGQISLQSFHTCLQKILKEDQKEGIKLVGPANAIITLFSNYDKEVEPLMELELKYIEDQKIDIKKIVENIKNMQDDTGTSGPAPKQPPKTPIHTPTRTEPLDYVSLTSAFELATRMIDNQEHTKFLDFCEEAEINPSKDPKINTELENIQQQLDPNKGTFSSIKAAFEVAYPIILKSTSSETITLSNTIIYQIFENRKPKGWDTPIIEAKDCDGLQLKRIEFLKALKADIQSNLDPGKLGSLTVSFRNVASFKESYAKDSPSNYEALIINECQKNYSNKQLATIKSLLRVLRVVCEESNKKIDDFNHLEISYILGKKDPNTINLALVAFYMKYVFSESITIGQKYLNQTTSKTGASKQTLNQFVQIVKSKIQDALDNKEVQWGFAEHAPLENLLSNITKEIAKQIQEYLNVKTILSNYQSQSLDVEEGLVKKRTFIAKLIDKIFKFAFHKCQDKREVLPLGLNDEIVIKGFLKENILGPRTSRSEALELMREVIKTYNKENPREFIELTHSRLGQVYTIEQIENIFKAKTPAYAGDDLKVIRELMNHIMIKLWVHEDYYLTCYETWYVFKDLQQNPKAGKELSKSVQENLKTEFAKLKKQIYDSRGEREYINIVEYNEQLKAILLQLRTQLINNPKITSIDYEKIMQYKGLSAEIPEFICNALIPVLKHLGKDGVIDFSDQYKPLREIFWYLRYYRSNVKYVTNLYALNYINQVFPFKQVKKDMYDSSFLRQYLLTKSTGFLKAFAKLCNQNKGVVSDETIGDLYEKFKKLFEEYHKNTKVENYFLAKLEESKPDFSKSKKKQVWRYKPKNQEHIKIIKSIFGEYIQSIFDFYTSKKQENNKEAQIEQILNSDELQIINDALTDFKQINEVRFKLKEESKKNPSKSDNDEERDSDIGNLSLGHFLKKAVQARHVLAQRVSKTNTTSSGKEHINQVFITLKGSDNLRFAQEKEEIEKLINTKEEEEEKKLWNQVWLKGHAPNNKSGYALTDEYLTFIVHEGKSYLAEVILVNIMRSMLTMKDTVDEMNTEEFKRVLDIDYHIDYQKFDNGSVLKVLNRVFEDSNFITKAKWLYENRIEMRKENGLNKTNIEKFTTVYEEILAILANKEN